MLEEIADAVCDFRDVDFGAFRAEFADAVCGFGQAR
jgi:hypothetical protein